SDYLRARAAAAGVTDRIHIETGYFPDVVLPEDRYDAIAMVEVIEHMPDHAAVLLEAKRLLRRNGRLFVSASCYRSAGHQVDAEHRPASEHAVELYGYTAMVPLSEIIRSLELAGFSITALSDLTSHYRKTMAHWQQQIADNNPRIDTVAPGFAREISRYFDTATAS
ncbi:class I SAM-dependent methyltransferase, partial [Nocardia thraciensis]